MGTEQLPKRMIAAPPEPPAMRRWSRRVLIGLSLVALLFAGFLARRTYVTTDEEQPGSSTTTSVLRTGPGLLDTFNRQDGPVGFTDNGARWETTSGTWEIDDQEAELVGRDTTRPRNIIVADAQSADLSIDLRITRVAAGSGLVFRYRNPVNYWMLTAAPTVGTWNLHRVVDGEVELVGNVGEASTAHGTVIGVRATADSITVLIGGRSRETWVDQRFAMDATRVGMVSLSSGDPGRFDDLVATVLVKEPGSATTTGSTTPDT